MLTKVYNMAGKQVGEIELPEAVFGIEPNAAVVHEAVKNHLANKHAFRYLIIDLGIRCNLRHIQKIGRAHV